MTLDMYFSIERESEAFARTVETGALDGRIPGCPAWSLRDLAWHLGGVQQFWTHAVRAGADVPPDFDDNVEGPTDPTELATWLRASTRNLVAGLRAVPPETPAWAWWRLDHTAGAIARHQVHEAAVHRWDAQSAVGPPEPLAVQVADDGIDEFLWIARQFRELPAVTLVTTDSGRTIALTDAESAVTVSATASDLVLLLYGRVSADDVQVEGNRVLLDELVQPVD
ncbi:MAG TPA: maleylpyruvate isomerase family mycothiol-dependent enzyme [Acidimicrobiia bacterium]|jgi:uncharacterized protein (TIGR03083 family)|nr:maleylpyruvate isomerase family mycothiol-dependent enzyme [Acidimicrobiia bacterium]